MRPYRQTDGIRQDRYVRIFRKEIYHADHRKAIEDHGFTKICKTDIVDYEWDTALPVNRGKCLKENYVGFLLADYDSVPILSHFRGQAIEDHGGAVKDMSE